MAWWALYKWFIPWRKTPYEDMIFYFKRFLYDEWFHSLSEEDKDKEKQRINDLKRKREQRGEEALMHLGQIYSMVNQMSGGRMTEYMSIANNVNNMRINSSKYW